MAENNRKAGRTILLLGLWLLGAWALPVNAEIYKWVDQAGVTHYSNTAPPGRGAKQADKMEEWRHDAETHAERIRATKAAQERELKQFQDQKEAVRMEAEARIKQAANRDTREAALERKIKFEQKRLKGLIHEERSEEWNAHVTTQLDLLAADPETYFEFQLDQAGRLPVDPESPTIQEESLESDSGETLKYRPHVTDPHTGELIPEEGGTGSRGTPYIRSGTGYLNTKTGRFFEIE